MLVPVSSRVSQGDTTNTSVSKRIIKNVEKCFRRSQNISVIATRSSVLTLASKKTRKSFFENQEFSKNKSFPIIFLFKKSRN